MQQVRRRARSGMNDTRFARDRRGAARASLRRRRRRSRSAWASRSAWSKTQGRLRHDVAGRIFQRDAPQSGGAGDGRHRRRRHEAARSAAAAAFLKPATARRRRFSNQIGALRAPRAGAGERFGFLGAVDRRCRRRPAGRAGLIDWGGVWGHNWILDPEPADLRRRLHQHDVRGLQRPFRDDIRDAVFG